jgi:multidrug efflux pump subunit AcrA (membrane-fusion protein)
MKLHRSIRGSIVNPSPVPAFVVVAVIAVTGLSACTSKPQPETLRAVRTAEIRYDKTQETDRYFGSVQSRYEVDQAFRVSGKVASRKVDVGQKVRQGDVIAVLDNSDYKLAAEAAQQQLTAAEAQARQAESDRKRLNALKTDGSVSPSDDEESAEQRANHPRHRGSGSTQGRARAQPPRIHRVAGIAGRRGHQR